MIHNVIIPFDDKKNALSCGLRIGWMTGTSGKGKKKQDVDLSCGAGTGSPYLLFSKTAKGRTVYIIADIRKIIPQLDAIADKKLAHH